MTRSVGVTLRRTAGGSVIFALGLGALASVPRTITSVSAAASMPPTTSAPVVTEAMVHHPAPPPITGLSLLTHHSRTHLTHKGTCRS